MGPDAVGFTFLHLGNFRSPSKRRCQSKSFQAPGSPVVCLPSAPTPPRSEHTPKASVDSRSRTAASTELSVVSAASQVLDEYS